MSEPSAERPLSSDVHQNSGNREVKAAAVGALVVGVPLFFGALIGNNAERDANTHNAHKAQAYERCIADTAPARQAATTVKASAMPKATQRDCGVAELIAHAQSGYKSTVTNLNGSEAPLDSRLVAAVDPEVVLPSVPRLTSEIAERKFRASDTGDEALIYGGIGAGAGVVLGGLVLAWRNRSPRPEEPQAAAAEPQA